MFHFANGMGDPGEEIIEVLGFDAEHETWLVRGRTRYYYEVKAQQRGKTTWWFYEVTPVVEPPEWLAGAD